MAWDLTGLSMKYLPACFTAFLVVFAIFSGKEYCVALAQESTTQLSFALINDPLSTDDLFLWK